MKWPRMLLFSFLVFTCFYGCEKVPRGGTENKKTVEPKRLPAIQQEMKGELLSQDARSSAIVPSVDFKPFYVYSDKGSRLNHYVPSGFMPNGKCIKLVDSWTEGCHAGSTCIQITYDIVCSREDDRWGGIYWLNPANNWGNRKGGYDVTGAQRIVFWARGDNGGEQIQEFTIGGITGDYPDSDIGTIGPVILSKGWKEYSIDLRGKDLSYISGGFAWTTSEEVNPESCVFYLDEIRLE